VNALQRTVQRVAASRPGAAFFRVTRVGAQDRAAYRLSGGRGTLTGAFAAFPTVFVTTTGARSGRSHTVALLAVTDPAREGRIGLIASNFGQGHDPDWCRNLRASPEATLTGPGARGRYTAEEVSGAAYERWFELGSDIYLGYPGYRARAGRHLPIFELTPRGAA
jgi:deazaflavin-dependent oxidoreductase (nitroreductase family)